MSAIPGGGGMFSVQFTTARYAAVAALAHEALAHAMEEVMLVALGEANQTCPIETGALIASGHTEMDAATLDGAISYDTPYAIVQHEDDSLAHDPGRRAHWLSLTLEENAEEYRRMLAERAAAIMETL